MENKNTLEETLILLENNNYPEIVGRMMLMNCLNILVDYSHSDFEKQMNRYLILERKYK
jgi:hypothetical protein